MYGSLYGTRWLAWMMVSWRQPFRVLMMTLWQYAPVTLRTQNSPFVWVSHLGEVPVVLKNKLSGLEVEQERACLLLILMTMGQRVHTVLRFMHP